MGDAAERQPERTGAENWLGYERGIGEPTSLVFATEARTLGKLDRVSESRSPSLPIGAPDYENVWNEIHAYFIWGYGGKSEEQILADVDTYDQSHLKAAPTNNRLFLGEWCMGGPPDQTGIFSNLDNFQKLGEKQLAYYNADTTGGWTFWTWRHSDETIKRTGWFMRYLIRNGYLKLA